MVCFAVWTAVCAAVWTKERSRSRVKDEIVCRFGVVMIVSLIRFLLMDLNDILVMIWRAGREIERE